MLILLKRLINELQTLLGEMILVRITLLLVMDLKFVSLK